MKLLLIEDDTATAQTIELMLRSEGINVQSTDLGQEGLSLALHYTFDVVILDINLPDMSGFEVLKALRAANIKTSVIILSGLAAIEDKVKGLNLGADDYMTKPFHKDELVARILAVVRRAKGFAKSQIEIGNLSIDIDAKIVRVAGKDVHITSGEWGFLEVLALNMGASIRKSQFLDRIYGGHDEPDSKIVKVAICKLRKKIAGSNVIIENLHGDGWALREHTA